MGTSTDTNSQLCDLIGVDLSLNDLKTLYPPDLVLAEMAGPQQPAADVDARRFELVVRVSQLERCITREAFGQALVEIPAVLDLLADIR
ncbi:MAG: hypothetical protein ACOC0Q_09660 [Wenzhouxiangella sp.]